MAPAPTRNSEEMSTPCVQLNHQIFSFPHTRPTSEQVRYKCGGERTWITDWFDNLINEVIIRSSIYSQASNAQFNESALASKINETHRVVIKKRPIDGRSNILFLFC